MLYLSCMDAMLVAAIVPKFLLTTLLIELPKPGGGARPISLFEEMPKAVDSILMKRISNVKERLPNGAVAEIPKRT